MPTLILACNKLTAWYLQVCEMCLTDYGEIGNCRNSYFGYKEWEQIARFVFILSAALSTYTFEMALTELRCEVLSIPKATKEEALRFFYKKASSTWNINLCTMQRWWMPWQKSRRKCRKELYVYANAYKNLFVISREGKYQWKICRGTGTSPWRNRWSVYGS